MTLTHERIQSAAAAAEPKNTCRIFTHRKGNVSSRLLVHSLARSLAPFIYIIAKTVLIVFGLVLKRWTIVRGRCLEKEYTE